MTEYIEREAAIAAIKKDIMGGLNYESILKRIPSADVQPVKHGKWDRYETCSVCGASKSDFFYCTETGDWDGDWNYCPNCGADMRETNDEKA